LQVELLSVVAYKGASETELADLSSEGKVMIVVSLMSNDGLLQIAQFAYMKLSFTLDL